MALDPRIPLEVKTPGDVLEQTLGNAQKQQSFSQAQQLQPGVAQEQGQTIDANKLTMLKQKNELALQALGTVVDQPSYERARAWATQQGLDVSRFPDKYDPNVIMQARMSAGSMAQQLNAMMKEQQMQMQAGRAVGDPTAFGWTPGGIPGMPKVNTPQTSQAPIAPQGAQNPGMNLQPNDLNNDPAAIAKAMGAETDGPPAPQQFGPPQATSQAPQPPIQTQTPAPTSSPQPIGFGPKGRTETTASYNARIKGAGGSAIAGAYTIMQQNPGMDFNTAYAQSKAGLEKGQVMQNGTVQNMPGVVDASAAQAGGVQTAKNQADIAAAAPEAANKAAGTTAVSIQQDINDEADKALATKRLTMEMGQLAQGFAPGKLAPMKEKLGSWAVAMGFDPDEVNKELGNVGDMQAMGKLTAQLATQSMKQFTSRGTQMEFRTFLENNPNIALTPDGFQKVLGFLDKTADIPLQKQQSFMEWKQGKKPEDYQDFSAQWNQQLSKNLKNTLSPQSAPPASADGWQKTPKGVKYRVVQ